MLTANNGFAAIQILQPILITSIHVFITRIVTYRKQNRVTSGCNNRWALYIVPRDNQLESSTVKTSNFTRLFIHH